MDEKIVLSQEKNVVLHGKTVKRPVFPWSKSVRRFVRHLEADGLPVEHYLDQTEPQAELTSYIDGEMVHPNKWSDAALFEVGALVARLHKSAQEFLPSCDDQWQPWCLREIGSPERIYCHGDIAPWNMITQGGISESAHRLGICRAA